MGPTPSALPAHSQPLPEPEAPSRSPFLGWKVEERILGIFSKCLPPLNQLQAIK